MTRISKVVDVHDNGSSFVLSSDTYVVEFAAASECDFACLVDDVVPDPLVGAGFGCCCWSGFW